MHERFSAGHEARPLCPLPPPLRGAGNRHRQAGDRAPRPPLQCLQVRAPRKAGSRLPPRRCGAALGGVTARPIPGTPAGEEQGRGKGTALAGGSAAHAHSPSPGGAGRGQPAGTLPVLPALDEVGVFAEHALERRLPPAAVSPGRASGHRARAAAAAPAAEPRYRRPAGDPPARQGGGGRGARRGGAAATAAAAVAAAAAVCALGRPLHGPCAPGTREPAAVAAPALGLLTRWRRLLLRLRAPGPRVAAPDPGKRLTHTGGREGGGGGALGSEPTGLDAAVVAPPPAVAPARPLPSH